MTRQVSLRLPIDMYKWVKSTAKNNNESITDVIKDALRNMCIDENYRQGNFDIPKGVKELTEKVKELGG
jgi:hypothetical protein